MGGWLSLDSLQESPPSIVILALIGATPQLRLEFSTSSHDYRIGLGPSLRWGDGPIIFAFAAKK